MEIPNNEKTTSDLIFSLPLLKQELIPIPELGLKVEPFLSRVDKDKLMDEILSGNLSPEKEVQLHFVRPDGIISGLSYFQAKRYARLNNATLLTRGQWFKALKYLKELNIENDFNGDKWELTDSIVRFSKDKGTLENIATLREKAQVVRFRQGFYVRKGEQRSINLIQRGGYVLEADEEGFPAEVKTKAEKLGPVIKPYYLPHIYKRQNGVVVCSGNFAYPCRDLSISIEPLNYKHPYISFRLAQPL